MQTRNLIGLAAWLEERRMGRPNDLSRTGRGNLSSPHHALCMVTPWSPLLQLRALLLLLLVPFSAYGCPNPMQVLYYDPASECHQHARACPRGCHQATHAPSKQNLPSHAHMRTLPGWPLPRTQTSLRRGS